MMTTTYVQYGCGLSAPQEWLNFDASPTLRIQRMPILGTWVKGRLNAVFPSNVMYGDIIKGLPIAANSCDGLYCSHTLEHLALHDFRKALSNSLLILKPGGIFRCIVPDLECLARNYIHKLEKGDALASISFINGTLLGYQERPRGIKGLMSSFFGNSHHLWMWDTSSLSQELERAGFREIRTCRFHDSSDKMFERVEDKGRFENAVAIECVK